MIFLLVLFLKCSYLLYFAKLCNETNTVWKLEDILDVISRGNWSIFPDMSHFSLREKEEKDNFDPYVCRLYIYYVIVVCVCFVLPNNHTNVHQSWLLHINNESHFLMCHKQKNADFGSRSVWWPMGKWWAAVGWNMLFRYNFSSNHNIRKSSCVLFFGLQNL